MLQLVSLAVLSFQNPDIWYDLAGMKQQIFIWLRNKSIGKTTKQPPRTNGRLRLFGRSRDTWDEPVRALIYRLEADTAKSGRISQILTARNTCAPHLSETTKQG